MRLRGAPVDSTITTVAEFRPEVDTLSWSAYLSTRTDATLFHELQWKHAVARAFGHFPRYLIARRSNRIVGVLPLFDIRSVVASRMLVSMPYATYGGILADDTPTARTLFAGAVDIAQKLGIDTVDLRSRCASLPDLPIIETHATFCRELPTDLKDVPQILPRKARAAARQAEKKHELNTTFEPHGLSTVWTLYSRSMRRLASPNYPLRFFEALRDTLADRMLVQLVRHEGRAVGGLVTFLYRDTMMPYFLGLDERTKLYGLSHFIYLKCMEWGVANGYRNFDFGRSRCDNKGAFDFKRHCGFEPTILQYQRHTTPGKPPPDLSPGSPKWALARRVWRGLPLVVTRPLGGWLAKSIPG